jgi:hypothetical protein
MSEKELLTNKPRAGIQSEPTSGDLIKTSFLGRERAFWCVLVRSGAF